MKTLIILFLIFASFLKGADTMKTVESVDLQKFMGKWFVIALVPNMIEKGATNSSDTYILNKDGTIDITYDAIKDGRARQIIQKGTVINKKSNAEWTIQMRKPFVPFMKFLKYSTLNSVLKGSGPKCLRWIFWSKLTLFTNFIKPNFLISL